MVQFLLGNLSSIGVGLLLLLAAARAVWSIRRRHKNGRTSCGGCSGCSGCGGICEK